MPHTTALAASSVAVPAQVSFDTGAVRVGCPVERDFYIVPGTGGHGRARADALLPVIAAFGCRTAVFGYDTKPGDTFLVMTGTQSALEALEILLPALAIEMERAARAAAKGHTTLYFREYIRGFGAGAAETIRAVRARMIEDSGPLLAQRVTEDAARVQVGFARESGEQKPLRTPRPGPLRALRAGTLAGRAAADGDSYRYLAVHDLVFAML
jgi:hypothetical protein